MTIAFDATGPAEAPTVVLLHGLMSSRESYAPVVEHLARRWHVLNVDMRGHGESTHATRYRAVDYAADVAELIRSEAADSHGRAVIAGHSLGGLTAAALAQTAPDVVAGLFLEDPPIFEGDPAVRAASPAGGIFPMILAALRTMRADGATVAGYETMIASRPSPFAESTTDRLLPGGLRASALALMRVDLGTIEAAISSDTWTDFDADATLPGPVTVLRADPAFGAVFLPDQAVRFASAVPQAQIVLMDGLGHGIHTDRFGLDRYIAALDGFLGDVAP